MKNDSIWFYDMRNDCRNQTDRVMCNIVRYGVWFYVVVTAIVVIAL